MRTSALLIVLFLAARTGSQPGVDQPYDPDAVGPKWLPGYCNPEWDSQDGATFEAWFRAGTLGDASKPKITVRHLNPANRSDSERETYFGWLPIGSVFEDPTGGFWMKTDPDMACRLNVDDWRSAVWEPLDEVRPIASCRITISIFKREEQP